MTAIVSLLMAAVGILILCRVLWLNDPQARPTPAWHIHALTFLGLFLVGCGFLGMILALVFAIHG